MNLQELNLKAGDAGLSTNPAKLAKMIRWGQDLWTKNSFWSHAFGVVYPDGIVEALAKISYNPLSKYDKQLVKIIRVPLSEEERYAFRMGMLRRVNGAYGWLKFPLFFADAMTTKVKSWMNMENPCFFFTKTFGISNIPVCSELVVWGWYKYTSYRLRDAKGKQVDWRIVTPDYFDDLISLPINRAEVIYQSPEALSS